VIDDNGAELSKGHFKPINSDRFVNDCHEYIFHLTPLIVSFGVPPPFDIALILVSHSNSLPIQLGGSFWVVRKPRVWRCGVTELGRAQIRTLPKFHAI